MAKIKNIEFNNFRNFKNFSTTFDNKLNILFGDNGCGKTNILEGISLIAKGRGIRNSNIPNLIKKKEDKFLIKNNLEDKEISINLKDNTSPVIAKENSNSNLVYVLMPMRV